jgi:hypothetical protein
VRDDCKTVSTSETDNTDGPVEAPVLDGGVLAALPRTRPQRRSPRRAAAPADTTTAAPAGTTTKAKKSAVEPAAKKPVTRKQRTTKPIAEPAEPPAPKQGYEPEEEVELGNTVSPPSGVELVESVADIVGELANSGLAAGGRILKDAFSLLRRP